MPETLLEICKASAGSGKTFRLTYEYIKLLYTNRLDSQSYRHILAVTFTNKATDEMKKRIISELFNLTTNKSQYTANLKRDFPELSQEECQKIARQFLNQILFDYSGFQISTIDAFFQQIVSAFTREIGLQNGYSVELDTDTVLEQSISNMLFDLDKSENKELLNWLIDFSEKRIGESSSKWDFTAEIADLSNQLFTETYKKHIEELSNILSDKNKLKNYRKKLQDIITQFDEKMAKIADSADDVLKKYALQPTDFKYTKGSFYNIFPKLREKNYEPSKRAKQAENNLEEWYSTQTAPDIKARIEKAYNELNPLLSEALNLLDSDQSKDYFTAKSAIKNLFILGILSDVENYIQQYTNENNLMLISNTNDFLDKIIKGSDTPFIYEKTGVTLAHYLIDEFQDTSAQQWNNFLPLLRESIAKGHKNLIVGDVKQSIYRWRNSDWKLLNQQVMEDFKAINPQINVLDTNWRSDKNVILFNNMAFTSIANQLANSFDDTDEAQKRAETIRQIYSDEVKQKISPNAKEGYVQVSFMKSASGWQKQVLENLATTIEKMQEAGYLLRQMAILTRTNREAGEIANFLLNYAEEHPEKQNYKYNVISNEALLLESSLSIQFIISLLTYLANPKESHNNAILITQYSKLKHLSLEKTNNLLGKLVSEEEWVTELFGTETANALETIEYTSLFNLTEQIIILFDLSDSNDTAFLQGFQDCIYEYSQTNGSDIKDFLDYWEKKSSKQFLVASDSQEAIRIMTIHSSKGLEFDTVFVPFCDWTFNEHDYKILWCEPQEAPFNEMPIIPVNYEKKLANSFFNTDYYNEQLYNYIDTLNVAYVAFTRAKHNLCLWVKPLPKNQDSLQISTVLHQFCTTSEFSFKQSDGENCTQFTLGKLATNANKKASTPSDYISDSYPSVLAHDKLKLHYQYSINGEESFSGNDTRKYGIIMHNLIANIDNINDIKNYSQSLVNQGIITAEEKLKLDKNLESFFSNEKVKDWFSGKYKVLNEKEILLPNGSVYRPDRIMIHNNRAIVVDYKFGNAKQNNYHYQVRRYIRFLTQMGYETEGYIYYVAMGEIEQVHL